MSAVIVRALGAAEAAQSVPLLAGILIDCVAGGASVGFMAELTRAQAEAFYAGCAESAARGERTIFLAESGDAPIGTVQLVPASMPNQPHRGDVSKMLVHRSGRGRGAGAALLAACEAEARARALTLLTLDTCEGTAAERLYLRAGWTRLGVIPNYALLPDGGSCDTVIFYKTLPPDG